MKSCSKVTKKDLEGQCWLEIWCVFQVTQAHMCNYCNYTTSKRYLLSRHMKSHSEERPHKCSVCERGFKTLASLQNHVNTHTGILKMKFWPKYALKMCLKYKFALKVTRFSHFSHISVLIQSHSFHISVTFMSDAVTFMTYSCHIYLIL